MFSQWKSEFSGGATDSRVSWAGQTGGLARLGLCNGGGGPLKEKGKNET
jgi:hypothetical protein